MYYKNVALLLLSVPFLTRAGPVSSVGEIDALSAHIADTKDCLKTGQANWEALLAKLKDDSATDVSQYNGLLKEDYDDVPTRDATPDPNVFKKLFQEDLHLDYTGRFAVNAVGSKEGGREAFVNMFNTNQGIVVGVFNDKRELELFQFFGVSNIGNPEYENMIDDIYKRKGEPRFGEIANKWTKWTYEENKDDFLAFLGTPKLGLVLRMLTDHSNAFDKRIPTHVYTNKWKNCAYILIDKYRG
ncbi:MAG: hypothetical protein Q9221_001041 [Calogaya cf. arnoldii]